MNEHPTIAFDDITTWRQLLDWAWTTLQDASPWLSPLLWCLLLLTLLIIWVKGNGWRKLKAVLKWAQNAVKAVDQFLTLSEDITYIKGQLQKNGGSTVKDAVHSLELTSARIEEKVDGAARTATEAKTAAAETQQMLRKHISNQST